MIVVFETKDSEKLSKFLQLWEFPEKIPFSLRGLLTMFALNTYFYRRVYRLDDLVIMSMKGFFEEASKWMLYMSIMLMFLSAWFGWTSLFNITFFTVILFMALISPNFRAWIIVIKMKLSGHKEKVSFPNNDFVITKLLFRFYESK